MYPLARTLYTTHAKNTHSKKWFIRENIHTPPLDHMDNNYYLYTLPTCLQEHGQIVILDTKITNYNLMHYLPTLMANQRDKRKSKRRRRQMDEYRKRLMAAARNPHMFVQGSSRDGQIEIKVKSEASSLVIKRESITPKLEYLLYHLTPTTINGGLRKFGIGMNKHSFSIYFRHQASACVSPFQTISTATTIKNITTTHNKI